MGHPETIAYLGCAMKICGGQWEAPMTLDGVLVMARNTAMPDQVRRITIMIDLMR
ncbi:hypothetical protein DPMN_070869 [Dreissena polymorpha]|uniref:Uncharacterized protein n=1 Tax=Dreissena polymorpha TaxID=45954 RepID=A0A9D4BVX9_DREPO|nr:hypothetical protein DPMN_070869 [Dreissena polymorpha]